eukprot:TRINITY_DN6058_c0_g1_i1.p1 TRINITY_DN6058_c0_g1~~TRINITY_DN6058_c0_g1_i1.p1  ORF type:complete len:1614 (-),score=341.66 TRINITY_DN6058_c0_g1_i1:49-4845(-)
MGCSRRRLVVAAAIVLALAAAAVVVGAEECTADDYKASYTACHADNTRDLLYYKDPVSTCDGGVQQPANVFNLRCDVTCTGGNYLPLGTETCAPCKEGEYSLGGGARVANWAGFPTVSVSKQLAFKTWGAGTRNLSLPLPTGGWRVPTDTTLLIQSGPVNNSQASILSLPVNLLRDGHVRFTFKVDSEPKWDGLYFNIDGTKVLPITSTQLEFLTTEYPLKSGFHLLQWVYYKDLTASKGADMATIQAIEVTGLDYADNTCMLCAPGSYSKQQQQATCKYCPRNTYAPASGSQDCLPCDAGTYSLEGSIKCLPKPACTSADYQLTSTPCQMRNGNPLRDIIYTWLPSSVCFNDNATLPAGQYDVPCGACNAGQFRPAGSASCLSCAAGEYSLAGSTTCGTCSAGTRAIRGLFFDQWNDMSELPFTTNCTGSCGTDGWQIGSNAIHSGVGHGQYANSRLQLVVYVDEPGTIYFQVKVNCTSSSTLECQLQYVDQGIDSMSFGPSWGRVQEYTHKVEPGTHTFVWNFQKQTTSSVTYYDRAVLTKLYLTTVASGGARECINCTTGTFSSASSTVCSNCSAGQSSGAGAPTCTPCPADTFNNVPGGTCIACGHATTAAPGSTSCAHDCTFTPDNGKTVFDLNPLKRTTDMYGPVYDEQRMTYYLNVCSLQHNNYSCFDANGKPIASYACQNTKNCKDGACTGMSLGDVIGFYPSPTEGLVLSYTHGSPGCDGVFREINITLKCSPGSGVGYPQPPPTKRIEGSPCRYNIVWETEYGCPVCSAEHYSFYMTPCENNLRQKIYYWEENPKRCHDGVALPPAETIEASCTSTIVCSAGQYVNEVGQCSDCPAGQYSVGSGNVYSNFQVVPLGFASTGFAPQGGLLVTGAGTSTLSNAAYFRMSGKVAFNFKVFASGTTGQGQGKFTFAIDGTVMTTVTETSFDTQFAEFPVSAGSHMLTWTYTGGVIASLGSSDFSGMALSKITVLGTDYSPLSCTPCEAGTYQLNQGASSCLVCPENTYAASSAAECTPCAEDMFSVPHSGSCNPRSLCAASDFQHFYTACSAGTRTSYYLPLQPNVCVNGYVPPANASGFACADCATGMWRETGSDECVGCPAGQYLAEGGACSDADAGSLAIKGRTFFGSANSGNMQLSELPTGWQTTCYGHCGSNGWRIRDDFIDSGFHLPTDSVMSVLSYTANLVADGTVSFKFAVTASSHCGLQFFVNGIRQSLSEAVAADGAWTFASVAVSAGESEFEWVFVQNPSTVTSQAQVQAITVSGLVDGSATVVDCPAGSYSGAAATRCERCAAGSVSANPKSSQCELCPEGMFSADAGGTMCSSCYAGTTSAQPTGSTTCVSTCVFNDTADDKFYQYDLTALSTSVGPISGPSDSTFYFNLCGLGIDGHACVDNAGNDVATHVCQVGSKTFDFGDLLEFVADPEPASGFSLVFHGGDADGCTSTMATRETVLSMQCSVSAGAGSPKYLYTPVQDPCAVTFIWGSLYACPVCTPDDYEQVIGSCNDGEQQVTMIRHADCNGPASYSAPVQTCSDASGKSFPIKYVVLILICVGVVLLAMAGVIAYMVFRHRKMTQRYNKLIEDAKVDNDQF